MRDAELVTLIRNKFDRARIEALANEAQGVRRVDNAWAVYRASGAAGAAVLLGRHSPAPFRAYGRAFAAGASAALTAMRRRLV